MESVAGMLENMKLSEAEKKEIRVKKGGSGLSKVILAQAIGKVLADRPVYTEALEQTLGKVWCPIQGIDCKDLGSNHFLFTFHQPSGKKRAIDDGPWLFGKDLIVVVDFDGRKRLEDVCFDYIPIWIRVSGLPLGLMNKELGEMIGNEVGAFVDMDLEEDGSVVGQFMRIKMRLNITKPLMRGVSLGVEDGNPPIWCPITYEFLPDFCYFCGIIGHIDKACVLRKDGDTAQFSKKLRYMPEKKRFGEDQWRSKGEQRSQVPWRSSRGRGRVGSGSWGSGSRHDSDGPSWRKLQSSDDVIEEKSQGDQEVTSPLKLGAGSQEKAAGDAKKALFLATEEGAGSVAVQEDTVAAKDNIVDGVLMSGGTEEGNKKDGLRRFKRMPRSPSKKGVEGESGVLEKKRSHGVEIDLDVDVSERAVKVGKVTEGGEDKKAGPANRSCEQK